MTRFAAILMPALMTLGWTAPALAMRCGSSVVQEGDLQYLVVKKCGEPSYRDSYPQVVTPGVISMSDTEVWYYDFGPQNLIQVLHFNNGTLTRITSAGYGFTGPPGRKCDPDKINKGMTKYELLQTCGEPQDRREFAQYVKPTNPLLRGSYIPVRVEQWTYDFGPGKFIRVVELSNGVVDDINIY